MRSRPCHRHRSDLHLSLGDAQAPPAHTSPSRTSIPRTRTARRTRVIGPSPQTTSVVSLIISHPFIARDRPVSPLAPPDPGDRVTGPVSKPPKLPNHAEPLRVVSDVILQRDGPPVNGSLDPENIHRVWDRIRFGWPKSHPCGPFSRVTPRLRRVRYGHGLFGSVGGRRSGRILPS